LAIIRRLPLRRTPARPSCRSISSMMRCPAGGAWAPPRAGGSLAALDKHLEKRGGHLCLRRGKAPGVLAALLAETSASAIYATRGYEPWEPALEKAVAQACKSRRADFDLFEPEAVLTGDVKPYRVYSSFWKACLASEPPRAPLPAPKLLKPRLGVTGSTVGGCCRRSRIGREGCAKPGNPGRPWR